MHTRQSKLIYSLVQVPTGVGKCALESITSFDLALCDNEISDIDNDHQLGNFT